MSNGTTTDWKEASLPAWYNQNMQGDIAGYARLFQFGPQDKVLDLGCGNGTLLSIAAQQGAHVTGVDISETQLALAQQALASQPAARLIHKSLQEVDFPSDSFTKVSARKAIHHLTNDEKGKLIDKIHHWLVPGGKLIIEDMILSFALHRVEENLPLIEQDAARYYGEKWPYVKDAFYTTLYKELPCDWAQMTHHLLFTGFHIKQIIPATCFIATVIAEK